MAVLQTSGLDTCSGPVTCSYAVMLPWGLWVILVDARGDLCIPNSDEGAFWYRASDLSEKLLHELNTLSRGLSLRCHIPCADARVLFALRAPSYERVRIIRSNLKFQLKLIVLTAKDHLDHSRGLAQSASATEPWIVT